MTRVGVWLVGARGSVATTAVVGTAAVRAGLVEQTGLVTGLPEFAELGLPEVADLVFGGHDVVASDPRKRVELLADAGVLPAELGRAVADDVAAAEAEVRDGVEVRDGGGPQRADVERISHDLDDFRSRHGLDTVVVVNVAATEPHREPAPTDASWALLSAALDLPGTPLPASSLYACAALLTGCPFVDFTPSSGARLPALAELAVDRGVAHAGSDGKTGETLVKSVLAAMFVRRALRVRSWSGTNLLGGGDGAALAEPGRAAAKAASKARVLTDVLGHPVDGGVHIHHVADLGQWKTAWDHIGFEGFLGTRMSLQFTWQGCDSALAAPLVLDLARLIAIAPTGGPVPELGFFFKDPVGTGPADLASQFDALVAWARAAAR
jgi:myo-inositol-1-phosphate synthase